MKVCDAFLGKFYKQQKVLVSGKVVGGGRKILFKRLTSKYHGVLSRFESIDSFANDSKSFFSCQTSEEKSLKFQNISLFLHMSQYFEIYTIIMYKRNFITTSSSSICDITTYTINREQNFTIFIQLILKFHVLVNDSSKIRCMKWFENSN